MAQEFVDSAIASNKIAIFAKSDCGLCPRAKAAVESFALRPNSLFYVDIDTREDCDQIMDYLKEMTGQRTVPRVFVDGQFIGGGMETMKARKDGSLQQRLEQAGALEAH